MRATTNFALRLVSQFYLLRSHVQLIYHWHYLSHIILLMAVFSSQSNQVCVELQGAIFDLLQNDSEFPYRSTLESCLFVGSRTLKDDRVI